MKKIVTNSRARLSVAVAALTLMLSNSAHAVIDLTAFGTIAADTQAAAQGLFNEWAPVIGAIMLFFIGIKLVKRFGARA